MVSGCNFRNYLAKIGILASLAVGCGADACPLSLFSSRNYATTAYSPSWEVRNQLFSTGAPDGNETEIGFPGKRDYENLFLFFDKPLSGDLKVDLRTGNDSADAEVNLIYPVVLGDVIDFVPIRVDRFILQPGEKAGLLSLEQALQEFELVRDNANVLDKEIKTIEVRNYGAGSLFVDSVEGM